MTGRHRAMSTPPPESSPRPVWSKRVGDASLNEQNILFCAGRDVVGTPPAEERLAQADLATNAAHLLMLVEQGLVTTEDGSAAATALLELRRREQAGQSLLDPACEDIHISIETAVTRAAGEGAGGRLHTARSRNDQVATDMRLWLRAETADAVAELAALAEAIAGHARTHLDVPCPGLTHGQPAMVTSWGHWTMSYLPRLLRDARLYNALLRELVTCPLGAAASFGTSWPIDRARAAELLGFRHPTPSGADGIWCRGELELRFAEAAAQQLGHLAGIAQDLILLSTPPRDWIRLADEHVTGSSIMPQKRNPDFAEVTRARAAHARGIVQSLAGITTALPSGYNRDTQWTKYLLFEAADNLAGAAAVYTSVFGRIRVNGPAMRAACAVGFLNATDVADYLARTRGLPFRSAYRHLGAAVQACEGHGALTREALNAALDRDGIPPLTAAEWEPLNDPTGLLSLRDQPGNPHPERTRHAIDLLLGEIREEAAAASAEEKKWRAAEDRLWHLLAKLAG